LPAAAIRIQQGKGNNHQKEKIFHFIHVILNKRNPRING